MSELATITLQPNAEYQNLATLAGVTFTEGTKYTLQVEGDIKLCEKATKPTAGGFRVNFNYPFEFEAGSDPLWVKAYSTIKSNTIVIAD